MHNYILYDACIAADNAWQHALVLRYGRAAGDARYDQRGVATPELRRLKGEYLVAAERWRRSWKP